MEAVRYERVPITSLVEDPANAREHDEKNLAAIKGSLTSFGQQKPIVVTADGVVIAGNGTLRAARELGWSEIDIARSPLQGTNARAYALADNRTAELAVWDNTVLTDTLKALQADSFDIGLIGFEGWDLSEPPQTEGLTDPDAVPENVETRCKPGDLWILGNHRLLCGDSTNVQHVERLMGGEKADAVITDPPYGIAYKSPSGRGKTARGNYPVIAGDEQPFDPECLFPYAELVVAWGANHYADRLPPSAAWLVWDKREGDAINNNSDCELAWCSKGGSARLFHHKWNGMIKASERDEKRSHPTQKPVALSEWVFETVGAGRSVLDLFLGSGSTLIACEKTRRRCFGMEIDPRYCDVILARWEQFTGKTAALKTGDETGDE